MPSKEVEEFVKLKNKSYSGTVRKKGVELIPYVRKVLEFLKKEKIKMGIASSAARLNVKIGL